MITERSNNFGLTERDLATIQEIFGQFPEIQTVFIFGSRAKGNFRTGSDIDLAIMHPPVGNNTLLRLRNAFEDSSLPYNVDIVNYPALQHADLKAHIDRVGRLFYQVRALQD
ncbi:MAG: nucleotidyltransferase domain-containing protein [Lewinellaceae bacterium]|nr:nucleotidyltransferase domain-containing protein [Lewinellaceae bacterium]